MSEMRAAIALTRNESKKRGKLAAAIADPTENPELFEEGLAQSAKAPVDAPVAPVSGRCSLVDSTISAV